MKISDSLSTSHLEAENPFGLVFSSVVRVDFQTNRQNMPFNVKNDLNLPEKLKFCKTPQLFWVMRGKVEGKSGPRNALLENISAQCQGLLCK